MAPQKRSGRPRKRWRDELDAYDKAWIQLAKIGIRGGNRGNPLLNSGIHQANCNVIVIRMPRGFRIEPFLLLPRMSYEAAKGRSPMHTKSVCS